jgi:hypothetical protein
VEMKKAPAVGSLWLLGGSKSERASRPRHDGRAPQGEALFAPQPTG